MRRFKSACCIGSCLVSLLFMTACGSIAPAPTPTPSPTPPAPSANIFVAVSGDDSPDPEPGILEFPGSATGSASPSATLSYGQGPAVFSALAVDSAGNLYAASQSYYGHIPMALQVAAFPPTSQGAADPTSTITLTYDAVLSSYPLPSLAVDATGDTYVATPFYAGSGASAQVEMEIGVYSPSPSISANGVATPLRTITGGAVGIQDFGPIALDKAANIYTSTAFLGTAQDEVLVFGPSASGDAVPTATLGGPNSQIFEVQAIALDTTGNLYVASSTFSGTSSILVFGPGAAGNVAPIRVISGSSTDLQAIQSLSVDSAGNIYVLEQAGLPIGDAASKAALLKFAASATGNVAPVSNILLGSYGTMGTYPPNGPLGGTFTGLAVH
jgi:hypothetical protein